MGTELVLGHKELRIILSFLLLSCRVFRVLQEVQNFQNYLMASIGSRSMAFTIQEASLQNKLFLFVCLFLDWDILLFSSGSC